MVEKWKDVAGYEGYYRVSDQGRVRSVDRVLPHARFGTQRCRGRILRPILASKGGHFTVGLYKNGTPCTRYIHQLVAAAWIGPCPDGQRVRHGPNGQLDNSVANLCYGTASENGLDMRRDGTHTGKAVRRSDGVEFVSMTVAAEETGCWRSGIWSVCNGKFKTTGGYGWEYITEKSNV